ncbi:MAG: polyribonucleotide nucleotidyltransferase [Candidatus Bipolaricaulota bacterium]
MYKKLETNIGGNIFQLETGKMAKQADGAVLASLDETKVLVTATSGGKTDKPYFPLRVDYEEKFYAGGKIPGGFIKREGKPSDEAILNARMIDRPIRPLFPDGYMDELHIVVTVLSASSEYPPEIAGMLGASAALLISPVPFLKPIAGVNVGRVDGELIANPGEEEKEESDLHITVAGTEDAVTMVEGSMEEVSEKDVVEAVQFGHRIIGELVSFQKRLTEADVSPEWEASSQPDPELKEQVTELADHPLEEVFGIKSKLEREEKISEIKESVCSELLETEADEDKESEIEDLVDERFKKLVRRRVVQDKVRVDGRSTDEVRPVDCEVGFLPRAHGSSLFTRGETQSLGATTLGTTKKDEQMIDRMITEGSKRFMLHYSFPPYSVGEAGYMGGPGRREIGHGHLAERAVKPLLPSEDQFPYIIRVVSEILESNGSSSMATVCSSSLSLMDAGVPLEKPVAGVGVGLVEEGDEYELLTDIMGLEDHLGDMDFKVAGTRDGVTAFQMDVKIGGISDEVMTEAMERAREARAAILDEMDSALPEPRGEVSRYAPVMEVLQVDESKIGTIIGPGGRTIRELTEETDTEIDIDDDGTVKLSGTDREGVEKARKKIEAMTEEVEVGETLPAEVVRIEDFGAFVKLPNAAEGLVHISQLADGYVEDVTDIVEMGDEIMVKVIGRDEQGRLDLQKVSDSGEDSSMEVGDFCEAEVTRIADFGAFVETSSGETGLVHISELANEYVSNVEDVVTEGDQVEVELINIDDQGRFQFRLNSTKS